MDTNFSNISAYFGLGDTFTGKGATAEDLIKALSDSSWQTRAEAIRKLGEITEQSEQDIQHLIELLTACLQQDQVAAVRATAALALGQKHMFAPQQPLLHALNDDDDDDVRTAAVQALKAWGKHLSQQSIDELIMTFFSEDTEYTRAAIIATLGELGTLVPLDIFEAALKDDSWFVRESAALAMGKQGDKANVEALEELLIDPSVTVCKAAVYALGKIWKETSKHLSNEALKEPEKKKDILSPAPISIIEGISTLPRSVSSDDTEKAAEEKETRTFVDGKVTFYGLEPEDFVIDDSERVKIPIIVQALDNQWITLRLSKAIFQGKLSYKDVKAYLEGLVRTEYIRSLINGEQVVINRAFLYNNSVLFEDYLQESPTRSVFKQFLQEGTIVPFLLYEHSPNQIPAYGTDREGFTAWEQICEEVHMQCIRFSWDNERHKTALDQFTARYHNFITTLESGKNIKKLGEDLGLASTDEYRLRTVLSEAHDLSTNHYRMQLEKQRKEEKELSLHITRNILYQNYVTKGSNPADRLYDGTKSLAGEMKQLLDLAYNGFLADELNGYLLTPIDSPNRAILQEWEVTSREKAIFTGDDFVKILRAKTFDLLQEGLYLKSMGLLTLQDVQQIRSTAVWKTYIRSLQRLLKAPALFVERAPEVYSNYVVLAGVMTDIIVQRYPHYADNLKAPWEPSVEIVANIGGVPLSVVWNELGMFYKHIPERKPFIVSNNGDAPFNMRLIIGNKGAHTTHTHARLFSSIELIKGKMPKALREWEKITREIRHILNAQEYSANRVNEIAIPTINEPR